MHNLSPITMNNIEEHTPAEKNEQKNALSSVKCTFHSHRGKVRKVHFLKCPVREKENNEVIFCIDA